MPKATRAMVDAVLDVLESRLAMYTRRTVSRMISVRTSTTPAVVRGQSEINSSWLMLAR